MSATLEADETRTANEFNYRPVPPMAVIAIVTGVLSLAGIVTEFALPIAILGCLFAFLAMRTFHRNRNEFSGEWMPKATLLTCLVVLFGGSALHAYTYVGELPEGYLRVNFTQDISKKGFISENGKSDFHEDVKELDGQNVFLKGYMYPEERQHGIRQFILCRDSGACCFGGQPKLTDMIQVVFPQDAKGINYNPGLVSVTGVFRLRDLRRAGDLMPAYEMEAVQVAPSKKLY